MAKDRKIIEMRDYLKPLYREIKNGEFGTAFTILQTINLECYKTIIDEVIFTHLNQSKMLQNTLIERELDDTYDSINDNFVIIQSIILRKDLQKEFCAAIANEDLKNAEFLLKRGAEVNSGSNIFSPENDLPLIKYAYLGKKNIVEWLIKNGADINSKIFNGNTAMHVIVKGISSWMFVDSLRMIKLEETLKFLIESGANPFIQNNEGDIPLILHKKISSDSYKFLEEYTERFSEKALQEEPDVDILGLNSNDF